MVQKPQVDGHHVVYKHEVAHLTTRAVPAVPTKQFHLSVRVVLIKLVKSNAGHAALVLLARAVNIEVSKARDLGRGVFKPLANLTAQTLVKQQLRVAIDVQRTLKLRRFNERV